MSARRLIPILSAGLIASATVVAAQPKAPARKAAPKKGPLAPAKDAPAKDAPAAATPAPAAPAKDAPTAAGTPAGAGEGSAVQMAEDPPPSDLSGTAENPNAPRSLVEAEAPAVVAPAPRPTPKIGFPIEEAQRSITLPQNMSEVSIAPHAVVSPYAGSEICLPLALEIWSTDTTPTSLLSRLRMNTRCTSMSRMYWPTSSTVSSSKQ